MRDFFVETLSALQVFSFVYMCTGSCCFSIDETPSAETKKDKHLPKANMNYNVSQTSVANGSVVSQQRPNAAPNNYLLIDLRVFLWVIDFVTINFSIELRFFVISYFTFVD